MALQAGWLNTGRITILRSVLVDDDYSSAPGEPAAVPDLTNIAADAEPVRDGERFAGGEMQATLTYRFLVRRSSATATITETDFVSYEGKSYGIAAAKEATVWRGRRLGRREGIEITATGRAETPAVTP